MAEAMSAYSLVVVKPIFVAPRTQNSVRLIIPMLKDYTSMDSPTPITQPLTPIRAIIYTRVSTAQQEQNYSLPTQLAACRQYALERGFEVVAERDPSAVRRSIGQG